MARPRLKSPNDLIENLIGLGGVGHCLVDLDKPFDEPAFGPLGVVRVGVARSAASTEIDVSSFDILICEEWQPPQPWVGAENGALNTLINKLQASIVLQPVAASVASQVFRMSLKVNFDEALVLESLAYSSLLASREFRQWRESHPRRERQDADAPRVVIDVSATAISIMLNRPWVRNAMDASMRDTLVEALDFAYIHPEQFPVILRGNGDAFCAGGDLAEFGQAGDPSQAHIIRVLRSAARLAERLGPRLTAQVHGACIGAGIEVAAAAGKVIARKGAVFKLPEVSMGLIPGAGGTATIPRRIGRHRACFMALSGKEIELDTALHWGLVDEIDTTS